MKTTKKHFEEFKAEFIRWQDYFGCMDWEIVFEHKNIDPNDAEVEGDLEAKQAIVRLSTHLTRNDPLPLAFHEAVELWLIPIRHLCRCRAFNLETMNQEFHGIVRFIENRLYPLIKGEGK